MAIAVAGVAALLLGEGWTGNTVSSLSQPPQSRRAFAVEGGATVAAAWSVGAVTGVTAVVPVSYTHLTLPTTAIV